jgi:hypothetical protein
MATVGFMGPYYSYGELAPGKKEFMSFGPSDGFAVAALSVTASPHVSVGNVGILSVQDVQVVKAKTGNVSTYYAQCMVRNDSSSTIKGWSVQVGVIIP